MNNDLYNGPQDNHIYNTFYTNDHDSRTICDYDRSINIDSLQYCKKESFDKDDVLFINPSIFRYKFTQEFMNEIYTFSKIHQYDDNKTFKEAWKIWSDENEELIIDEINRLEQYNYRGNIMEKMYKSARYYFRKKGTKKNEPKERCEYVNVQKNLIDVMDKHIYDHINEETYKPSSGFVDFCNSNVQFIKEEVSHLIKYGYKDPNEIKNKIKKTYKNRYFLIIKDKINK
jgi:hypothetical protein